MRMSVIFKFYAFDLFRAHFFQCSFYLLYPSHCKFKKQQMRHRIQDLLLRVAFNFKYVL